MDSQKWYQKLNVKNLVYKLVLPIYLWSIGYKTLDEYAEAMLDFEQSCGTIKRLSNIRSK